MIGVERRLGRCSGSMATIRKLKRGPSVHPEGAVIRRIGGPGIVRVQTDVVRVGSGNAIPNGARRSSDFRLARRGCAGQPPCLHLRPQRLFGRQIFLWQFVASKVWPFGMDPEDCPSFPEGYGWRIIEDVSYHEFADKYIVPTGDSKCQLRRGCTT
jgi:hypothetical protein